MILLDTVFINNSGGKVLLNYLVKELELRSIDVFYLFDNRCINDFSFVPEDRKQFLKGKLKDRHKYYRKNRYRFSKCFCFGNIPPTLKLKVPVFTYFHNVSLLEQPENYKGKEKFLKLLKYFVIRYYSSNSDYFIVQTNTVKELILKHLKIDSERCLTIPFYDVLKVTGLVSKQEDAFVYISNGNTHKNHDTLIKAWYKLGKKNLFPQLHLTITKDYPFLLDKIADAQAAGIKIINHGYVDPKPLYKQCKYLIYPSLCESFGLGLIEGAMNGCNIIASDLPYVYEVVTPSASFQPLEEDSIANVVENALKCSMQSTQLKVNNEIEKFIDLFIS